MNNAALMSFNIRSYFKLKMTIRSLLLVVTPLMLNNFGKYYALTAVFSFLPTFFILKNFKLTEKFKEYFHLFRK